MRLTGIIGIQVAALCIASVLVGCASTGDDSHVSLYASKTALSGDVYYARAPSMQTAERELAECLFRVAGQVSLRKKVFVRYIVYNIEFRILFTVRQFMFFLGDTKIRNVTVEEWRGCTIGPHAH